MLLTSYFVFSVWGMTTYDTVNMCCRQCKYEIIEHAYLDIKQGERRRKKMDNEEFPKFYYRTNCLTMIKHKITSREGMWHAWETYEIRKKLWSNKICNKVASYNA
jgi:hypothetical protein